MDDIASGIPPDRVKSTSPSDAAARTRNSASARSRLSSLPPRVSAACRASARAASGRKAAMRLIGRISEAMSPTPAVSPIKAKALAGTFGDVRQDADDFWRRPGQRRPAPEEMRRGKTDRQHDPARPLRSPSARRGQTKERRPGCVRSARPSWCLLRRPPAASRTAANLADTGVSSPQLSTLLSISSASRLASVPKAGARFPSPWSAASSIFGRKAARAARPNSSSLVCRMSATCLASVKPIGSDAARRRNLSARSGASARAASPRSRSLVPSESNDLRIGASEASLMSGSNDTAGRSLGSSAHGPITPGWAK